MTPKILQRCDVCKRYHVSYVVEDAEFGKRHLCTTCWNALYGGEPKKDKHDQSNPPKKIGQA